jgi:hypothetical protein
VTNPVTPAPITWGSNEAILTPMLRADPGNAIALLTRPPLFVGGQATTAQPVSTAARSTLELDSETADRWAMHQIPNAIVASMFPGWYLTEGAVTLPNTGTAAYTKAGLDYNQGGSVTQVDGTQVSNDGVHSPMPNVVDLIRLNSGAAGVIFFFSASGATFTAVGSSYANGTAVVLASRVAVLPPVMLPGGAGDGVVYYVVSASGDQFSLSSAIGGSPITLTAPGTGYVYAAETVALSAEQDSGGSLNVSSASLSSLWVGQLSGTVVPAPVQPAPWPPGSGVSLTAGCAAGATVIGVSSAVGMVVGGTLGLDTGTLLAESVIITGISGLSIAVSNTAYPHAANAAVAVPISGAWMNQQVRDLINFQTYPPMARLNNSGSTQTLASQLLPAGTAVTWVSSGSSTGQTAWLDNFGGWSSGQPTRYAFPVGGIYYVYGLVGVNGSATAYTVCAGLRVSGGTTQWGDGSPGVPTASVVTSAAVRRILRVTAGQYVELMASQNLGTAQNINSAGTQMARLVVVWRGF